jgi:hypothetical protein
MIAFDKHLRLDYIDGRVWALAEPFWFKYVGPDESCNVEIQPGFLTDFHSIPRFFWRVAPPTEWAQASVIHDYCYRQKALSRHGSDLAYLEAMEQLKVPAWRRQAMYRCVRMFGEGAYGKDRTPAEVA